MLTQTYLAHTWHIVGALYLFSEVDLLCINN